MDWTVIIVAIIGVFASGGFWEVIKERKIKKRGTVEKLEKIQENITEIKEEIEELKNADKKQDEYRVEREREFSDNLERLKRASAANLEWVLMDFYRIVREKQVYTLDERVKYHYIYRVYKNLGYDHRMDDIREAIMSYPDENGVVHPYVPLSDEDSLFG